MTVRVEPVPVALLAHTATLADPLTDGVPDMSPVLVFRLRPVGRADEP